MACFRYACEVCIPNPIGFRKGDASNSEMSDEIVNYPGEVIKYFFMSGELINNLLHLTSSYIFPHPGHVAIFFSSEVIKYGNAGDLNHLFPAQFKITILPVTSLLIH